MSDRAGLHGYNGSSGFLVDSNVWIDCIDDRSDWHRWAVDRLQACSEQAPLHVDPIIYTELLVPGTDVAALDALLDVYDTLRSPPTIRYRTRFFSQNTNWRDVPARPCPQASLPAKTS